MPGVARDMNGYRDFEEGHLRTSSYANGHDPYWRERDGMRDPGFRRHNGVDDIEQNSFDMGMRDGNEPSFEVDHLATYTSKAGTTHPEDGLTKLKQMESSTGIWTMRCMLIVDRRNIVIIDKGNGDELERFPISHVHEPTAVLKNDRRETYNNLVLFSILDDPRRKHSPSDMHIFQSVNAPAHDIVDEILSAKGESGSRHGNYEKHIPPPPNGPAPEPPYGKSQNFRESNRYGESFREDGPPHIETRLRETRLDDPPRLGHTGRFDDAGPRGYGVSRVDDFRASYIHREDMDTGQNEALERDVQLLNNCFDDIEKFVSRLQQAAEAYKELERRRMERGGKKKQKSAGDGMLMMRARPPPAEDFIDIFQKFKFAFNLLAKLKPHIHDPNAPELVHFLFTPLSLIYEASRDPIHGGRDLSSEAVAPLLLYHAKQLLLNCLTSKELELWQRLGRPWTLVKDEWHGAVPSYNPRFYNGWQPSPLLVDEVNQQDRLRDEPVRSSERIVPYVDPLMSSRREDPYSRQVDRRDDPYRGNEEYNRPPSPTPARAFEQNKRASAREPVQPVQRTRAEENAAFTQELKRMGATNKRSSAREPVQPVQRTRAEENASFMQELQRMGATIFEAFKDRQANTSKELTVETGDIVQVLDKSRNWWKLKNYQGEIGFAPYTILKECQHRDDFDNNGGGRLSGEYSSYINGGAPPAPPPPMAGSNRPSSPGGDKSFRYF